MKLALASDHGGFHLKKALLKFLDSRQIGVVDLGTTSEDSVDYPDYAAQVARQVAEGKVDGGVLVCGTGIGMAITANKFKGVRAAVVSDPYTAQMSKEHNNANVICIPARFVTVEEAEEFVNVFLNSSFEGGRHQKRVEKIELAG